MQNALLCCGVCCQVLENLLLAAKLRLPVTGKGQGMAAAAWRHVERQRHREVHKVVGEVMALMGLTKVATTVSEVVVRQQAQSAVFIMYYCMLCTLACIGDLKAEACDGMP